MTEGRKNINIKRQHRRGNGSTDKGREWKIQIQSGMLDISILMALSATVLSVLKINVWFFHSMLLVRLSLNFYRFSHFSSLCLIPPSDVRHSAICTTRNVSDSHRGNRKRPAATLRLIDELLTFSINFVARF
jgi:hypothetical protein